jgi:hypothetical protein
MLYYINSRFSERYSIYLKSQVRTISHSIKTPSQSDTVGHPWRISVLASEDKCHSYQSISNRPSERHSWPLREVQIAILSIYLCSQEKTSVHSHPSTNVPQSDTFIQVLTHAWQSISLPVWPDWTHSTQRTSIVACTHVHVNAGQGEHPCGRRLLGHEAVELFVPSVPFDGIKCGMLQVVIAG